MFEESCGTSKPEVTALTSGPSSKSKSSPEGKRALEHCFHVTFLQNRQLFLGELEAHLQVIILIEKKKQIAKLNSYRS